uniref:Uncharacterized protein n=2 Tax=Oryza sativa subsp. japonica TaxID=39947 RepID=Q6AU21_ORYSJ|nr:hypothetical protein [Oryza sativa Japonica Group]AAT81691.1 hypothetical protein [Oryza sativa Japonica Group]ABF97621.1 hypothetical protein LOC_Os03g41870 [Oryza sativa Japonica Group]
MSTRGEMFLEPLLLDGSNYISWSTRALNVFRAMGPHTDALSDDVFKTIMPLEDAHLIWITLKERYDKSKCDGEDTLVEASFGDCSTSLPHHDKSQVIISSNQEGLTSSSIPPTYNYEQEFTSSICSSSIAEDHVCFMGHDDDSVVDHLNKKDTVDGP